MKYLIAKNPHGLAAVFMCSAPETHEGLANALKAKGYTVVSAAYCRFRTDFRVETYGRSTSLGMGPREQDAALIGLFYKMTADQGAEIAQDHNPRPL